MEHFPESWGRPRNDVYGPYDHSYIQGMPTQHTQRPIVTGTSVIGLMYKDGVIIAADNLASFGSLARFTSVHRLIPYSSSTLVGFGGDVSDMQYISRILQGLATEEGYELSAHALCAANLHKCLSNIFYRRRTKMDPLWNAALVGGFSSTAEDSKPFLASVDLLGTTFTAPSICTGFGAHLAQPLLRRVAPDFDAVANLSREDAEHAIRECMKVLFYRDARSLSEFSIAVITKEGTELKQNEDIPGQSWAFAEQIRGYGA